jgi:hypothetical protein
LEAFVAGALEAFAASALDVFTGTAAFLAVAAFTVRISFSMTRGGGDGAGVILITGVIPTTPTRTTATRTNQEPVRDQPPDAENDTAVSYGEKLEHGWPSSG